MLKRFFFVAVIAMATLAAEAVAAQLAENEVYVGQAFTVVMDHDGANTTAYRLYRNGEVVATVSKASAFTSGVVTFPARSEAAAGTFTYHATAVNSDGSTTLESAASASVSLVVLPTLVTPNTLTLPRIIKIGGE